LVEIQDFLGFKIARHIFPIHVHSPTNGSWIKGHENDFRIAIDTMKISCIEVAQSLNSKLKR
jgi:hypothetical protein